MPFEYSRRLVGANLFFADTGALLETLGVEPSPRLVDTWRRRVARAAASLNWPASVGVARAHAGGASLALSAPCDQLLLATEVNEWALCASLGELDPSRWRDLPAALRATAQAEDGTPAADPPVLEESAALQRFGRLAEKEALPVLRAWVEAARARDLPYILDESSIALGAGAGSQEFGFDHLPAAAMLDWTRFHAVPTALVTGSNGKTTTVRLLAACARAQGWVTGFSCTDGVFVDGAVLAEGDYSGPVGARMVLRDRRVQAALVETARGGILRRGISVTRTDVAVVTNVSADHFGEYGIDDLASLADVKLTVAAVLKHDGLLVLNAADALLRAKALRLAERFGRMPALGWFAAQADHDLLRLHRAAGGATCGALRGRLLLHWRGAEADLGEVAAMPLAVGGAAAYNVENLAAAGLAAAALGIPPAVIARVFARFGARPTDNIGRMMRFERAGVQILIDYAHNPEGMRGLLTVAESLRQGSGRLAVSVGHAGNRRDVDIEDVAKVVAEFKPDLVIVKENEAQLRGRERGDIPRILQAALLRLGVPAAAIARGDSELEAVRIALRWARAGDVLALPVHSSAARSVVLEWLSG